MDVVPKFLAVCIETLSIAADDDKESSNRRRRQQPSDGVIWVPRAWLVIVGILVEERAEALSSRGGNRDCFSGRVRLWVGESVAS